VDSKERKAVPFIYWIHLSGPKGEVVRFSTTFDDGAMVNAIDEKAYDKIKHRLSSLHTSRQLLKMADSRLVPSRGTWKGEVMVNGVTHTGQFEVFNSGGAWTALFGKTLLQEFKAVHDYESDEIHIPNDDTSIILRNHFTPNYTNTAHKPDRPAETL